MTMDITKKGEAGVIAWCNNIRFSMAKDPGRQFLDEQVQKGFDFLDSYIESVVQGPKTESVTELLKTPGRKKPASKKTRTTTTLAQKADQPITVSFDEDETSHGRHTPVSSFHQALLQAKSEQLERNFPLSGSSKSHTNFSGTSMMERGTLVHSIGPSHISSPEVAEEEVNESRTPSPNRQSPVNGTSPGMEPHEKFQIATDNFLEPPLSLPLKELSIIAEDDEQQHSRLSLLAPDMGVLDHAEGAVAQPSGHTHVPQLPSGIAQLPASETRDQIEVNENHTTTSAQTFDSIPLGSPHEEERISVSSEYMTAPLPPQPLMQETTTDKSADSPINPVPVIEQVIPEEPTQEGDFDVPIKDASPPPDQDSRHDRNPSLANFTGLSAPSPLRKSTRFQREPSVGPPPAPPAAPVTGVVGGKRSSWLVKAREARALEGANKRVSTLAGGISGSSAATLGSKRKSVDISDHPILPASTITSNSKTPEEERMAKMLKLANPAEDAEDQSQPMKNEHDHVVTLPKAASTVQTSGALSPPLAEPTTIDTFTSDDFTVALRPDEEGALQRFKKTVEGARVGKSMGKSLGGNAAAALAEARKAAEARVAERLRAEGQQPMDVEESATEPQPAIKTVSPMLGGDAEHAAQHERRLSISDLALSNGKEKQKNTADASAAANTSTSTTPPNSPPPALPGSLVAPIQAPARAPPPPVFSKPPVFVPPAPKPAHAPKLAPAPKPMPAPAPLASLGESFDGSRLPKAHPFTLPVGMNLGVPANFSTHAPPLTAQSSKESFFSDMVFDRDDTIPAWMPRTQDTDYSIFQSQPKTQADKLAQDNDLDEDDSWHVDEHLRQNQMWTPFGLASEKDDTWSTMGSRSTSQKGGDTGPLEKTTNITRTLAQVKELVEQEQEQEARSMRELDQQADEQEADEQEADYDGEVEVGDVAMEIDEPDEPQDPNSDLEDIILDGKPTITLVKPKQDDERPRSQSQQSNGSAASSSQSQVGFFGQASKLMSSMLGASKKTKPEPVKSLQLAAAAAKKQQEETEKKANRLKEMEARRQQAMQKKAEEGKARVLEEERKIKEENDRRKREREEQTDKRPIKGALKKGEETDAKKRKIGETDKKPEMKKPPSKDKIGPPRGVPKLPSNIPSNPGTASKPVSTLKSIAAKIASSSQEPSFAVPPSTSKAVKTVKSTPSSSNLKAGTARSKTPVPTKSEQPQAGPSQTDRAKTPDARTALPPVASESIELPDINSEYSDSDDENRPRAFDPPDWAQSPVLREALQQQSTLNPDDIFGRIGPLRMEEIFRTRQSRFRARTSSANWAGADELTREEEIAYARRMGFR